jgi:hypothetical protein
MDNNEKFNINVTLSDWRLQLTAIPRVDEEIYRRAEKIFNDELKQTLQTYRLQSAETLKLLAYNTIVNLVKANEKYNDLVEKLQSWGNDVDNILNE